MTRDSTPVLTGATPHCDGSCLLAE